MDDEKTRVPAKNEGIDVDLMLSGQSNGCDFNVVGSPQGLADLIKNLTPNGPAKSDAD